MPSFLSKVFGRKNHEHDHEHDQEHAEASHVTSPLSPGELLEGRFEAISPNISPSATRFDLDSSGKPSSGNASGNSANSRPGRAAAKDKEINVFGLFKAKSRPSSPEVQHRRLLDTLPHLKLDFEHSQSTGKGEPSSSTAPNTTADFLQADSVLSDAVIGQRRLNPLEALVLIRACSKVITSRGLETLGIMTPHWYSASPDIQRRLISLFLNSSSAASTNNGLSPSAAATPAITLSPSTALSSTASPLSSFEDELSFTRSIHDVAAVLRWGLRHLQLDNGSFGSSEGEGWYQSFISSEAEANYPPKAFSQHLAVSGKVPTQHLELLVATLEIFSSLAALTETNGTSGSKLSKVFGLWLLTGGAQPGDGQDWRAFYERWERTGRILEHLFLARIRDESTDRRMPTRLLELVRKYPYTQGLSPPSTDRHLTSGLLQRPQFTTASHDALYVRIAYELPSTTTGTSKQKHKHKHRIHPSTLIADALSSSVSTSTSFSPSSAASSPSDEEFVALWQIITSTAQRVGTEAPLSSVFADDTIRLLKLVGERRKEGRKTPAFELLKSIAAQSPASANSKKGDPASSLLSPLALNLNPKTNGGANGSASWEHFSTSGFESSVPPLASTLFDTDVERTEPPQRVESPSGVGRKLSGKWGPRKSGEIQRAGAGLVAPKMEPVNSSSSGQSGVSNASNTSNSNGPAYFNTNAENAQAVRPRRISSLTIKPTHMSIIQIDEAFVDFWSDALLDPVSKDWPTFVICKFKKGVVDELAFGGRDQATTSQEGAEGDTSVESEDSKGKEKEAEKGETKRTIKYLVLEQVYTVRQPTPPSTPGVAATTAPPLHTAQSSSESAMSPISPQSAKKRFSFWNPVSRSTSTSSVGSLKGRKTPVQKVGELGELGEVVEEESGGTLKGSGKDRQRAKTPTPTSTPPKKKRKSFDISDLGLKISGKDKEVKEKEVKEKEKDKETQKEVQKDEVQVPATIAEETPAESSSSTAKVAAVAAGAVAAAGAAVGGIVAAASSSADETPKPEGEAHAKNEAASAEEVSAAEEAVPVAEDEVSKPEILERDQAPVEPQVEVHNEETTPKQEGFPATATIEPSVEDNKAAEPSIPLPADKASENLIDEHSPPSAEETTMASSAVDEPKPAPEIVEYKNVAPSAPAPAEVQHPAEPPATQEVTALEQGTEPEVQAPAEETVIPTEPSQHAESPGVVKRSSSPAVEADQAPEEENPSITVESVEPKPVDDEADDALELDKSTHVPVEPEAEAVEVKDNEAEVETAPAEVEASPEPTYKEDVDTPSEPAVGEVVVIEDVTAEEEEVAIEPSINAEEGQAVVESGPEAASEDVQVEETEVAVEPSAEVEAVNVVVPDIEEAIVPEVSAEPAAPADVPVEEETSVEPPVVDEQEPLALPSETQVEEIDAPDIPQAETERSDVADVPVDRSQMAAVSEAETSLLEAETIAPEAEPFVEDQLAEEEAIAAPNASEDPDHVEGDILAQPSEPLEPEEKEAAELPEPAGQPGGHNENPVEEEAIPSDTPDVPAPDVDLAGPVAEPSVEEPTTEPIEEAEVVDHPVNTEEGPIVEDPVAAHVYSEPTSEPVAGDESSNQSTEPSSEPVAETVVHEEAASVAAVEAAHEEESSSQSENVADTTSEHTTTEDLSTLDPVLVADDAIAATEAEDNAAGKVALPEHHDASPTPQDDELQLSTPLEADAEQPEPQVEEPEGDSSLVDSVLLPDDQVTSAEESVESRPANTEAQEITNLEVVEEAEKLAQEEEAQAILEGEPQQEASVEQLEESETAVADESTSFPTEEPPNVADETVVNDQVADISEPEVTSEKVSTDQDVNVVEEPKQEADSTSTELVADQEKAEETLPTGGDEDAPVDVGTFPVEADHHSPAHEDVHAVVEEKNSPLTEPSAEPVVEEQDELVQVTEEEAQPEVEATPVEPPQESESTLEEPEPSVAEAESTPVASSVVDDTPAPVDDDTESDPAQPSEAPVLVEEDQESVRPEEPSIVSIEPHTEPVAIPEDTSKEALVDLPPVPVIEAQPIHELVDAVTVPLPEPEPLTEDVQAEQPAAGDLNEAAEHVIESGSTPGPQLTLSTSEDTANDADLKPEESLPDDQVPEVVNNAGPTDEAQIEDQVTEEPPAAETHVDTAADDEDNGLGGAHPHIKNLDAILAKLSAEGANENDSIIEDREHRVPFEDESPALEVVDDTSAKDEEVINDDVAAVSDEADDAPEPVAQPETIPVHDEDESDEKADSDLSNDDTQHAKAGTEESDKTIVVPEAAHEPILKVEDDIASKHAEPARVADLEPSVLVEED